MRRTPERRYRGAFGLHSLSCFPSSLTRYDALAQRNRTELLISPPTMAEKTDTAMEDKSWDNLPVAEEAT